MNPVPITPACNSANDFGALMIAESLWRRLRIEGVMSRIVNNSGEETSEYVIITTPMKLTCSKLILILMACGAFLVQGCVAFPPLVQVEHKHEAPAPRDDEVLKRLDSIDQRLNQLESNQAKQQAK